MHMTQAPALRVLIAHEAPIISAGLSAALSGKSGMTLAGGPLRATVNGEAPDVVITDYENGIRFLAERNEAGMPRRWREARVLIFTDSQREQQVRHALTCGADGYLLKSTSVEELVDAVRALGRGARHVGVEVARLLVDGLAHQSLTAREIEVLRLVALGWPNKSIARELGVAACTVKSHVQAILSKLDVATRTEAARVAVTRGFVSGSETVPGVSPMRPALSLQPSMIAA